MSNIKKKEPIVKKETRELPVKLSEAEVTEYGRKLAQLDADLRTVQNEKKNAADEYKGREAAISAEAGDYSRKIRDGQEHRMVDVELTYDLKTATRTTTRTDTKEVVNTAPMTAQEIREVSQGDLPFGIVDGGKSAEA